MTKKCFIQAAKIVVELKDREDAKKQAETLAHLFALSNPRFDRGKFFTACGVSD